MKKRRSMISVLLALAMLGGCSGGSNTNTGASQTTAAVNSESGETAAPAADNSVTTAPAAGNDNDTVDISSLTSLDVVRLMGNGINLGNTLEAYNHKGYLNGQDPDGMECGWGQPYTTAEMMRDMKSLGFDSVRIPVAWTNGMNFESGDYTIDERLMTRVETVVDYALDADMFVIINDHWDGSWWGMFGSSETETRDKAMEMYKSMWTQIGERFADRSYKLIFESANEELGDRLNDSDITGSKGVLKPAECYETANLINSEFVKTIRSLGGNNAERFLLIAGYNTDIAKTCDERFKMPDDPANKLLLSVHYYTPWDFCGTDGVNQWGSPTDYDEQNGLFKDISKFSEQGYGIVIGEYAVMMKSGGIKDDTAKFYDNLLDNCDLYDCCPMLWDCSNFYKRATRTTSSDELKELFDKRRLANEGTVEEVKAAAKKKLEETREAANDELMSGIELPPSDDMAIAWLMYTSSDWTKTYCVGDTYDPTNMTTGLKATNVQVTGEGQYTVALDFTGCGAAKGVVFSAIGISNGEKFFPDYTISIDEVLVNGEPFELTGKEYTTSDDGKCTRVNLYNEWVSTVPDGARTPDGDLEGVGAKIMQINKKMSVDTVSVTFTYSAPKE